MANSKTSWPLALMLVVGWSGVTWAQQPVDPGLGERLRTAVAQIFDGRIAAGTYPAARETFDELASSAAPGAPAAMFRLVEGWVEVGDHERSLFGLALLRAWTGREDFLRPEVGARWLNPMWSAPLTATECEELAAVYGRLPDEAYLDALGAGLAAEDPLARARVARALGEVATAKSGEDAAALLLPMLSDPHTTVRLATLEGLAALAISAETLGPVAERIDDPDLGVQERAIQLVGARGVAGARGRIEALATEATTFPAVRQAAVVALGQLGDPASTPALQALVAGEAPVTVRVLAAWSLAQLGAEGAGAATQDMLLEVFERFGPEKQEDPNAAFDIDDMPPQRPLYAALGRLGGPEGLTPLSHLLDFELDDQLAPPEARRYAIFGLGYAEDGRQAVGLLHDLADRKPARGPSDGGAQDDEYQLILQSIMDVGGYWAQDSLNVLLEEAETDNRRYYVLRALFYMPAPEDEDLFEARSNVLAQLVSDENKPQWERTSAASALYRFDPDTARALFPKLLDEGGLEKEFSRSLAQAAAAVGEPGYMEQYALSVSRAGLEQATPERRGSALVSLGIDQLYAGTYEEAAQTFGQIFWTEPDNRWASYNIACAYGLSGDLENCLRHLRRSIRSGYRDFRHMVRDTDLRIAWEDPRFLALRDALALAEELERPYPDPSWP